MAVSKDYLDFIHERLAPFGAVTVRRMFGGAGIHYHGVMFALVVDDELYFKVDEASKERFLAEGSGPFAYNTKKGERRLKSYYKAPDQVLDEEAELLDWARRAVDAALAADRAKKR